MLSILLTLLAVVLSAFYIYKRIVKPLYFWDERKVPNVRGWPIVGKQAALLSRKIAPMEWIKQAYNEFPDRRYSGTTQFNRPILIVREPDLIKQVTIKDFDHFVNRIDLITEEIDDVLGKSLLFRKNDEWKTMRCTLSPAFTGVKMRAMFNLMHECADQFADYFADRCTSTTTVQTKEVVSRFTTDVIASCAFGVNVNSMTNKDNEFFVMGKEIGSFGAKRIFKLFLYSVVPFITKIVGIPVFSKKVNNFFRTILTETMQYREKHAISRPDMIQLLMQARKGQLKYVEEEAAAREFAVVEEADLGKSAEAAATSLSDDDLTAQALVFFFAGFEPVSTALSFLLHELAMQRDVQDKLREEIAASALSKGTLGYDEVVGMKYLDMVVTETLRKWPAVPILHRTCTKDYLIKSQDKRETDLLMKKGQALIIPTVAIHHDEKYYPNPHTFDAERFSEANRHNVNQAPYLPFGAGPRNCIGSRFALLEIKIFVCSLVRRFEIVQVEKTAQEIKLAWQITLAPENGFWVGFKPLANKKTA